MLTDVDWTVEVDLLREYAVRTVGALGVVGVTVVLSLGLGRAVQRTLARHRAHANAATLVGNTARLVVGALGGLVVLGIYSPEASAWLLGSVSLLGLVVGLSLQDLLRNFFAGVWLLIEQPIRIGETIEVGGATGVVERISYRVTWIMTADGRVLIVPNVTLLNETVVNLSRSSSSAKSAARYSQDTHQGGAHHE